MPVQFKNPEYKNDIWNAAIQIIQAKFPDYVNAVNTTIEPSYYIGEGVNGRYHISGEKAGNIEVALPKGNFTTDNVIELVGTMLHEIHHARTWSPEGIKTAPERELRLSSGINTNSKEGIKEYYGLEEKVIKAAENKKIPSVFSENFFNNLSELVATAVPTLDMKDRQIQGKYLPQIEELAQDPVIKTYFMMNRYPEVPTMK